MPLPQDLLLAFGEELLDCVQGPSVCQSLWLMTSHPIILSMSHLLDYLHYALHAWLLTHFHTQIKGGKCITVQYLESLSQAECIWWFWFTKDELVDLSHILYLPSPLITTCGYKSEPIEALGLLCACLHSPEDQ